jgi:hypothetical protein
MINKTYGGKVIHAKRPFGFKHDDINTLATM